MNDIKALRIQFGDANRPSGRISNSSLPTRMSSDILVSVDEGQLEEIGEWAVDVFFCAPKNK